MQALKQARDLLLRGAQLAVGLLRESTVPTPEDAVEGAFAFAGQVLQRQNAYALRMTGIVTGAAEPAPAKTK